MTHIKTLLAAGKRYEWSVTEPDVHISGNTAWIAYVKGASPMPPAQPNQTWLESAVLQKQAGNWKIGNF